ncbi:MAG: molybdopterin synthase catalytic subunit MoaE [Pseudohongiellaceae bacterium]
MTQAQTQVQIQEKDFELGQEYQALREAAGDVGAIVTFSGLVRELYAPESAESETVAELFLEHYPGMTEKRLQGIVDEACQQWPLLAVKVLHRVGRLLPGEQIVFVGVASAHRRAALDAARYIMDYLKSHAPFWKKQLSNQGLRWIESRQSDHAALAAWEKSAN